MLTSRRHLGRALAVATAATVGVAVAQAPPASAAGPMPLLQMPFPCGQSWDGNAGGSSAHAGTWEIDFNRGGSPRADLGDAVVAAGRGRVVIAANQGSANRYGNLVKIDHGDGWSTYYAHLRSMSVRAGATVAQGQRIGELGESTRSDNDITPHLHFEVRRSGTWPSNVEPARFDGARFGYPRQTLASRNCGDPEQLCGAGYTAVDEAYLPRTGAHRGTVYLMWDGAKKSNCVVTVKHRDRDARSSTSAYLQPAGGTRTTDAGSFFSYAGPVRRSAPGCVRWGGAIGAASYASPSEHCS